MRTTVNGPDDVAIGDIVEVTPHHTRTGKSGTGKVTKATADKLTVKFPDGSTTTAVYSIEVRRQVYLRPGYDTRHSFTRLGAWERWRLARPATPDMGYASVTIGDGGDRSIIGKNENGQSVIDSAIRDRPDEVCAQVRALSEWLKVEPSKEAP